MLLKIGELARLTGLTIRTLHHYDSIGLLSPSARTQAGYRLYQHGDLDRRHRIMALRKFGLVVGGFAALQTLQPQIPGRRLDSTVFKYLLQPACGNRQGAGDCFYRKLRIS